MREARASRQPGQVVDEVVVLWTLVSHCVAVAPLRYVCILAFEVIGTRPTRGGPSANYAELFLVVLRVVFVFLVILLIIIVHTVGCGPASESGRQELDALP